MRAAAAAGWRQGASLWPLCAAPTGSRGVLAHWGSKSINGRGKVNGDGRSRLDCFCTGRRPPAQTYSTGASAAGSSSVLLTAAATATATAVAETSTRGRRRPRVVEAGIGAGARHGNEERPHSYHSSVSKSTIAPLDQWDADAIYRSSGGAFPSRDEAESSLSLADEEDASPSPSTTSRNPTQKELYSRLVSMAAGHLSVRATQALFCSIVENQERTPAEKNDTILETALLILKRFNKVVNDSPRAERRWQLRVYRSAQKQSLAHEETGRVYYSKGKGVEQRLQDGAPCERSNDIDLLVANILRADIQGEIDILGNAGVLSSIAKVAFSRKQWRVLETIAPKVEQYLNLRKVPYVTSSAKAPQPSSESDMCFDALEAILHLDVRAKLLRKQYKDVWGLRNLLVKTLQHRHRIAEGNDELSSLLHLALLRAAANVSDRAESRIARQDSLFARLNWLADMVIDLQVVPGEQWVRGFFSAISTYIRRTGTVLAARSNGQRPTLVQAEATQCIAKARQLLSLADVGRADKGVGLELMYSVLDAELHNTHKSVGQNKHDVMARQDFLEQMQRISDIAACLAREYEMEHSSRPGNLLQADAIAHPELRQLHSAAKATQVMTHFNALMDGMESCLVRLETICAQLEAFLEKNVSSGLPVFWGSGHDAVAKRQVALLVRASFINTVTSLSRLKMMPDDAHNRSPRIIALLQLAHRSLHTGIWDPISTTHRAASFTQDKQPPRLLAALYMRALNTLRPARKAPSHSKMAQSEEATHIRVNRDETLGRQYFAALTAYSDLQTAIFERAAKQKTHATVALDTAAGAAQGAAKPSDDPLMIWCRAFKNALERDLQRASQMVMAVLVVPQTSQQLVDRPGVQAAVDSARHDSARDAQRWLSLIFDDVFVRSGVAPSVWKEARATLQRHVLHEIKGLPKVREECMQICNRAYERARAADFQPILPDHIADLLDEQQQQQKSHQNASNAAATSEQRT